MAANGCPLAILLTFNSESMSHEPIYATQLNLVAYIFFHGYRSFEQKTDTSTEKLTHCVRYGCFLFRRPSSPGVDFTFVKSKIKEEEIK